MKVLFLSWAYPKPNTPYLGIWAHQQALALKAAGVEVDVVNSVPYVPQAAGALSDKIRRYSDIPGMQQMDGITVYHPKFLRVQPNSWLDKFLFRAVGLQSRRLAGRVAERIDIGSYQVLHAHNLFPDGALAYWLHRRYGIPYVLTLHDVDRFHSFPVSGGSGQQELSSAILSHASKVLAVSRRVGRNIEPYVDRGRLQLMYNTFWTKGRAPAEAQAETAASAGKRRIVTIASLIERKGVFELLRAFRGVAARHPDHELVMVGQGRLLPELQRTAGELGIADRVRFTGALPHDEAMRELAQAAVFCLPSWDEAFGVAYAEAMSYGIPVIGCRGEGIADVVTDGENGLLVGARDVAELEAALLRLVERPADAARIGASGRACIRDLRPEVFGPKLAGLYREIAAAR